MCSHDEMVGSEHQGADDHEAEGAEKPEQPLLVEQGKAGIRRTVIFFQPA